MGLTGEQWLRINQVHELVKQEGDAACEAALDDLIGLVNQHAEEVAGLRRERDEAIQHLHSTLRAAMGNCSTDFTDYRMAVLGAEGWRIRATQSEADLDAARSRCTALEEGLNQVLNMSDGIIQCKDSIDDEERAEWSFVCKEARALLPPPVAKEETT